jgi:group I intron endonuclease
MSADFYGVIYIRTCKVNGKQYVGQTVSSPAARLAGDLKEKGVNRPITNALRKYGKDAFIVETIWWATNKAELDQSEDAFIELFDTLVPNGYNLKRGGGNGRHHLDTIAKMKQMASLPSAREIRRQNSLDRWAKDGARDQASKRMIDAWEDPEIRERRIVGLIEAANKRGPEFGVAISRGIAEKDSTSARSKRAKVALSRPDVRDALRQASKRNNARLDVRETLKRTTTASWKEPAIRTARSEGIIRTKATESSRQRRHDLRWINNGVKEQRISSQDEIPDGWSIGRLKTVETRRHWITDGYYNKMIVGKFVMPDGWYFGKTSQPLSDEHRNKVSEGLKRAYRDGKRVSIKGCVPWCAGKKGVSASVWINDGIRNSRLVPGASVPEGWIVGRLMKKRSDA